MEGAGRGSEKKQGIIQHTSFTGRLWSRLKPAGKATEFFADESTEGAKIFPAIRLFRLVRESVRRGKTDGQ